MKYFEITFAYHSRPLYRTGKVKTEKKTFAASNITDAYVLARDYFKQNYPRHSPRVVHCEDITRQVEPS